MFREDVWALGPRSQDGIYTHDVTTGEWYKRTADALPMGTLLFSIDSLRDKTQQSGKSLYPWYFQSNHLSRRGMSDMDAPPSAPSPLLSR